MKRSQVCTIPCCAIAPSAILIPAIVALAWGNEIEKEITARGLPLPDGGRMREWLPRTCRKMAYWFVGMVIIAYLTQR